MYTTRHRRDDQKKTGEIIRTVTTHAHLMLFLKCLFTITTPQRPCSSNHAVPQVMTIYDSHHHRDDQKKTGELLRTDTTHAHLTPRY